MHQNSFRPQYLHRNSRVLPAERLVRCNFILVAVLTISSTALTAYILNVIANNSNKKIDSDSSLANIGLDEPDNHFIRLSRASESRPNRHQANNRSNYANGSYTNADHQIMDVQASEGVETRLQPDVYLKESGQQLKRRLASMSRPELLEMLRLLQQKIDTSAKLLKKRNAGSFIAPISSNKQTLSDQNVVIRSPKMNDLINHLDKIESSLPTIDSKKLESIVPAHKNEPVVRIIKPSLMDALFYPSKVHSDSFSSLNIDEAPSSWTDTLVSLTPPGEVWPQQVEVEDWPSSTIRPSSKPKKKKRKKVITTTSTTTTSTTPAPSPETIPPTTAPPSLEEVWIEEEEDIYRPPPRKKTKKYKKKTSPSPEVTTTTTTTTHAPTTTTTTTKVPTTVEPIEDWPEDPWPQSTTKEPWPAHQQQEEKWPEEEWLDAVKDKVQNQLNVIYV